MLARRIWFWLASCLSLFLVGCTSSATPVSSTQPSSLATLNPTWLSPYAQPSLSRLATSVMVNAIQVETPTCYDTTTGKLVCMGLVYNRKQVMITNVRINVVVHNSDGQVHLEQTVLANRPYVPAGEMSPYSAEFSTSMLAEELFPIASIVTLQEISSANDKVLSVSVESHKVHEKVHQLQGKILLAADDTIGQVWVVVALLDANNRVTGIRQWRSATLSTRQVVSFQLQIIPQGQIGQYYVVGANFVPVH